MDTKRLSVLFLPSWYPSKEHPTLGNFIQKHAEAINLETEITVLYVRSSEAVKKITVEKSTVNDVETIIVFYPKVKTKLPLIKDYLKFKRYSEASLIGFNEIKKTIDLVHVNIAYPAGLFALNLKRKYKLKYLITEQWTGYLPHKNEFSGLNPIVKWQQRKIFKQAEKTLVVSSSLGDALKKQKLVNEYEVIPNVVNPDYFYPLQDKKQNLIPRFIHISTFDDKHKNISGMMRCFKKLEDAGKAFELHLIVEGEEKIVSKFIAESGINKDKVEVSMNQTAEQIGNALRRADCLVLFSNYETFSVVLAEAWACGVPAIYSKCGGLTDIQNELLGHQIDKKNEKELFEKILDFTERDEHIFDTTVIGETFYPQSIARKVRQFYMKVLKVTH